MSETEEKEPRTKVNGKLKLGIAFLSITIGCLIARPFWIEQQNVQHNEQYFSTLWRKKIPRLLAEQAQKNWLIWYYTNEEYGEWKTCGRCGETKLAHPLFFSRNTSKDHYYSICKECRRKK